MFKYIFIFLIALLIVERGNAATIHVDSCTTESGAGTGSPTQPFRTIGQALDVAEDGDTISAKAGAYPEKPVINKPLVITGSGGSAIIGEHGATTVRYKTSLEPVRVRILNHNIYALSDACEERGSDFGEIVACGSIGCTSTTNPPSPIFDIVAVQEYWYHPTVFSGCDNDPLLSSITATGFYSEHELFDPDGHWYEGGVGIFTLHSITNIDYWFWDRKHILKCKRQGFQFTRIPIQDTDITLDVYNVHTCGESSDSAIRDELQQLADKISELSGSSGNPVVVMGDFNIEGPLSNAEPEDKYNELYNDIMTILGNPRDIWLEAHGDDNPVPVHPFDGYTKDDFGLVGPFPVGPFDPLKRSEVRRIDYIFVVTDQSLTNSPYTLRIIDQPAEEMSVVKWKSNSGLRVSDHLGVRALFEVQDCK